MKKLFYLSCIAAITASSALFANDNEPASEEPIQEEILVLNKIDETPCEDCSCEDCSCKSKNCKDKLIVINDEDPSETEEEESLIG